MPILSHRALQQSLKFLEISQDSRLPNVKFNTFNYAICHKFRQRM